ncbi:MAG TPA: SAM-dependent methyltransferase [Kineosporiaceae bacterium]
MVEYGSQQEQATDPPEPDYDWSWTEEDDDGWVPPTVDITRPSAARIYDYCLGGKDNFEVDRDAAECALQVLPDGRDLALANRRFLRSAVAAMARSGIRQFLDLGTGIPTSPNVHETARTVHADARVVYVDNDPIVLAHGRAMLDGTDGVTAVMRDLREPAGVLNDPRVRQTISLDEPVGLLLVAVLHFVDVSLGAQVVRHYVDRLVPGSQVAISVGTSDGMPRETIRHLEGIYQATSTPVTFRTFAQTEELVDGLALLEPGIVDVARWFDPHAAPMSMRMYAGIGVKDGPVTPRRG